MCSVGSYWYFPEERLPKRGDIIAPGLVAMKDVKKGDTWVMSQFVGFKTEEEKHDEKQE